MTITWELALLGGTYLALVLRVLWLERKAEYARQLLIALARHQVALEVRGGRIVAVEANVARVVDIANR